MEQCWSNGPCSCLQLTSMATQQLSCCCSDARDLQHTPAPSCLSSCSFTPLLSRGLARSQHRQLGKALPGRGPAGDFSAVHTRTAARPSIISPCLWLKWRRRLPQALLAAQALTTTPPPLVRCAEQRGANFHSTTQGDSLWPLPQATD